MLVSIWNCDTGKGGNVHTSNCVLDHLPRARQLGASDSVSAIPKVDEWPLHWNTLLQQADKTQACIWGYHSLQSPEGFCTESQVAADLDNHLNNTSPISWKAEEIAGFTQVICISKQWPTLDSLTLLSLSPPPPPHWLLEWLRASIILTSHSACRCGRRERVKLPSSESELWSPIPPRTEAGGRQLSE